MLRIFQNLRKSIINVRGLRKYLFYAFGEILLVMIGILLALQVNNWNQNTKQNKTINSQLKLLKRNLIEDQKQILDLANTVEENYGYADSLMLFFKDNISYEDRILMFLAKSLRETNFTPNTNAYETMIQSDNLGKLSSDLQRAVLNYYALVRITKEREERSNFQIQDSYEPLIFDKYPFIFQKINEWDYVSSLYHDDKRPITEINVQDLKNDKTLEVNLISRHYMTNLLKEQYKSLENALKGILEYLE